MVNKKNDIKYIKFLQILITTIILLINFHN